MSSYWSYILLILVCYICLMYGCNLQKRAMHIAGHNQQQLNKKAYNLIVLKDKTHPHTVDGITVWSMAKQAFSVVFQSKDSAPPGSVTSSWLVIKIIMIINGWKGHLSFIDDSSCCFVRKKSIYSKSWFLLWLLLSIGSVLTQLIIPMSLAYHWRKNLNS